MQRAILFPAEQKIADQHIARLVRRDRFDLIRLRVAPPDPALCIRSGGHHLLGKVGLYVSRVDPSGGGLILRQHGDINPTRIAALPVMDIRKLKAVTALQFLLQIFQHPAILDLDQTEDVWLHLRDQLGQPANLHPVPPLIPAAPTSRRKLVIARIGGIVIRIKEVLHIPARDRQRIRRLFGRCLFCHRRPSRDRE